MRSSVLAAILGLCAAAGCQSRGTSPAEKERPADPATAPATTPAPAPDAPRRLGTPLDGHLVSQATVNRILASGTREQWFGLYMGDKKYGFARLELRPARAGEPGAVAWIVDAFLRAGMSGDPNDVSLHEERFYERAPPHSLIEVRSTEASGENKVERIYRHDTDAMVVRQVIDGRAQPERRLPRSAETLLSVLDQYAVEPREVRAGMNATVAEFKPDADRDELVAAKVVEVRQERLSGVETTVVVLSTQAEGEHRVVEAVIASGGVVLSAALGGNLEVRSEDKEQAQSNVAGFDMIADAVKIDRPIGEPSTIRELHLRVAMPGSLELRDAPNQELTRRPDGALDVDLFSRPGLPVLPAERRTALAVTSSIDAGDPTVAALARSITEGESDPALRVERLIQWTYKNLDKDLSTNLTTASQVLAHQQGDCTEHALLFVALARAAGIPAREVSGLVYMGDAIQRFGWHAWAEVDLGGRWVQVDPSWGEPLANATHLTLGVGDESDWVAALGGLDIKLRDAHQRDRPAIQSRPWSP